jgi:hypothetical protein
VSNLIRALASSGKKTAAPKNPKAPSPSGVNQQFVQSGSHGGGGGG